MRKNVILIFLSALFLYQPFVLADTHDKSSSQMGKTPTKLVTFPAEKITWGPGPEGLPKGAQMAVLQGDPAKENEMLTLRFKFPKGFVAAPHTHPVNEYVTVISGKLALGHGEKFVEKDLVQLGAGSFFTTPVGMAHYARAEEETVVQLQAIGRFGITYVNPADDPRNKEGKSKSR